MNLIVITNLFPNPLEPHRSPFNLKQIRALANNHDVTVVSPVSWVSKIKNAIKFKSLSLYKISKYQNIEVRYPTYYYFPGMLRYLNGYFMFFSIYRTVMKIHNVDKATFLATWLYPDAFSTMLLANKLSANCFVKVHGTDVEEAVSSDSKKKQSIKVLQNVDAVVSVSEYLKTILSSLCPATKIFTIYNGIDKELFNTSVDQADRPQELRGYVGKVGLFVGNFKKEKGVLDFLSIFDADYCIKHSLKVVLIGGGAELQTMSDLIATKKLTEHVLILSKLSPEKISHWYKFSDFTCLPSYHEGLPNVLLESVACGTPVVASKVGGIPEIINDKNGRLVDAGDIVSLKESVSDVISTTWDRVLVNESIKFSTWDENAAAINKVIELDV